MMMLTRMSRLRHEAVIVLTAVMMLLVLRRQSRGRRSYCGEDKEKENENGAVADDYCIIDLIGRDDVGSEMSDLHQGFFPSFSSLSGRGARGADCARTACSFAACMISGDVGHPCPACSCTTASEAMESKPPSPTMASMNSDWE